MHILKLYSSVPTQELFNVKHTVLAIEPPHWMDIYIYIYNVDPCTF